MAGEKKRGKEKAGEFAREKAALQEEVEKRKKEVLQTALSQNDEMKQMREQFELVNGRYDEMKKLVSVLKKQLQERSANPLVSMQGNGQGNEQENPLVSSQTNAQGGAVTDPLVSTAANPLMTSEEMREGELPELAGKETSREISARVRELEQSGKSKDGRISSLELLVERLKKNEESNMNELMELKVQNDELEKKAGKVSELEGELYKLQVKYNEMVDEYTEMRETVTDLRDEKVGSFGGCND